MASEKHNFILQDDDEESTPEVMTNSYNNAAESLKNATLNIDKLLKDGFLSVGADENGVSNPLKENFVTIIENTDGDKDKIFVHFG